jgi:hypothetical protein
LKNVEKWALLRYLKNFWKILKILKNVENIENYLSL